MQMARYASTMGSQILEKTVASWRPFFTFCIRLTARVTAGAQAASATYRGIDRLDVRGKRIPLLEAGAKGPAHSGVGHESTGGVERPVKCHFILAGHDFRSPDVHGHIP